MRALVPTSLPETPSLQRQWLKVWGPHGTEVMRSVLVGHRVSLYLVHYDLIHRRVIPCVGEAGCPLCPTQLRRNVKGFIEALRQTTRERFVCEVTEAAYRQLRSQLAEGTSWRNHLLTLRRKYPDSKQSPVLGSIAPYEGPIKLPEPMDIEYSIMRQWDVWEAKCLRAAQEQAALRLGESFGLAEGEVPN